MTLKVYHKKRDFKKTGEPKGRIKPSTTKNLFIIQKHAASHLHYDFRLELNGVLLSWAVPKGPSLDPKVKRLAMHVEDHPVEYGGFEGIIPKGEYGGGTVMLWDKGRWHCDDSNPQAAYRDGHLKFTIQAEKLNGQWKLVRMNKNDKTWLLIKAQDEYARPATNYDITLKEQNSVLSNQSMDEITKKYEKVWSKKGAIRVKKSAATKQTQVDPFPISIRPELATLVDTAPQGAQWLHEIKFDGYRLIAFKQGKIVKLFTRNQHDWTSKFNSVAKAIANLPIKNVIIDGEVVILDKNKQPNFQLLQNAIKEGSSEFYYYAFDMLYADTENLMQLPLIERKNKLKALLDDQEDTALQYSNHIQGNGKNILKKACALGLEGIISKEADSHYTQKRSKSWLKSKCTKGQEFVVGGFIHSTRRQYFRSLMLGTYNNEGQLIYNGNVGTGFTQDLLKSIYTLLLKHKTDKSPFTNLILEKDATWLNPKLVAEIEFTEWTDAGTLRHPSFKGLRKDKLAKKITRESEVNLQSIRQESKLKLKSKKKTKSKPKLRPVNIFSGITHPDKILFSEDKITKLQLAEYYLEIQDWILPYISNRPLSLVRCPANYKNCFYQKHISHQLTPALHEVNIKDKSGTNKYPYLNTVEGLIALTQMSVLEIHPWGSHIKKVEYPDMIIFDIDPDESVAWQRVVKAAFEIKNLLEALNLKSFVKTTGGKGLHVVIPIKPQHTWDDIKKFSHALVEYMVIQNGNEYVGKMSKLARKNKIFIDYLRNQRGATSVAPYSTRARIHAPISTPLHWDELTKNSRDTYFDIKTLPQRLLTLKNDPWSDFFKLQQSLNLKKFKI